jgi:tryptophan synthase alpha chain
MLRARASAVGRDEAFDLISQVRERWPDLPIGLLVYANLVVVPSVEHFYAQCRASGVDSVLCADVPVQHIDPFRAVAEEAGVQTVLVVPPNVAPLDVEEIASRTQGYTYLLSRNGVTGTERAAPRPSDELVRALAAAGAPPAILGFGISTADHVRSALDSGAAGVVVGSAFCRAVERHRDPGAAAEAVGRLTVELAQGLDRVLAR